MSPPGLPNLEVVLHDTCLHAQGTSRIVWLLLRRKPAGSAVRQLGGDAVINIGWTIPAQLSHVGTPADFHWSMQNSVLSS
jgi:hypothetical protein